MRRRAISASSSARSAMRSPAADASIASPGRPFADEQHGQRAHAAQPALERASRQRERRLNARAIVGRSGEEEAQRAERRGEGLSEIGVTELEREIGTDFEVGPPRHERSRPRLEAFGPDARVARLRDTHGPHGVPPRDGEPLVVSLRLSAAELPQRLEKTEAIGACSRCDNHRAVDERRQQVGDQRSVQAVARAHFLGRFEPERRRKDGEPAKERLLLLGEQLIAPPDDAGERALALGEHLGPPAEQCEAVGEPLCDLARRKRPQSRRRELERERQTVEALAHLRDCPECLAVQLEVAAHCARPLHEKSHRVGVEQAPLSRSDGREGQAARPRGPTPRERRAARGSSPAGERPDTKRGAPPRARRQQP